MHHKKTEIIFAFVALLISGNLLAQQMVEPCDQLIPFKVVSENGINMRTDPDSTSSIIQKLAYQSEVSACDWLYLVDSIPLPDWIEVQYDGKKGFVKSKFLKKMPRMNILIPGIYPGDLYPSGKKMTYAFKGKEDDYNHLCTDFKTLNEIPDTTIRYPDGTLNTGLPPSELNKIFKEIIFGISGFKPSQERICSDVYPFKNEYTFLYPGQKISYSTSKAEYMIYADGHPVRSLDSNESSPFSKIENYEFHIRRKMNGKTEDKVLYRKDINTWVGAQYEGDITIHWIGDIDNDDEMDLLLVTSSDYRSCEVRLFLSSKRDSDKFFFKEVYTSTECDE